MKKWVKAVISVTLFAGLFVGTAFAAETKKTSDSGLGKYGKLTIGYATGGADAEWDFGEGSKFNTVIYYSGFEVVPTFGIEFPVTALEEKKMNLALEGSIGLTFGGDSAGAYESSTIVINPGVMGIINYHFDNLPKLVPYVGLGFSVPIQLVSVEYTYTSTETDSTEVGFKINTLFGARYDINDKFSALGEFGLGIFGVFSWAIRAGVSYHF